MNKPRNDGFTLVVYPYPIMTFGNDTRSICSCAVSYKGGGGGGTAHEGIPHRLRHGGSRCNIRPRPSHARSGRSEMPFHRSSSSRFNPLRGTALDNETTRGAG
ncbi:uncharacterized protein GLRG_06300 [Colletotrichum graminicola M1.001]|uniref:Uncharacterized protein n=1 Tax=Colletotrichum graminicola (strain M1.001 / M2 / FGSC 10212) TaxID=645133 RepID=E3QJW8_COLGM|nr:uncharacterized protein GLRG_06300 [Colletotrichum graminicola M1.001]EFQ31156.1 hypothetical protein GLRG_06300 [Colletotrichum graminicola M1.001]